MKAHQLLATPDKWTKGEFARNREGLECGVNDTDAVRWCVIGAIRRCYGTAYNARRVAEVVDRPTAWMWNDAPERTHADVLAVLRELDI